MAHLPSSGLCGKRNTSKFRKFRIELFRPFLDTSSYRISCKKKNNICIYCSVSYFENIFKDGENLFPRDEEGNFIYSNVDYVDTCLAMEKLVKKGLTKSIGISNFNHHQIERVLNVATIKPVTNQVFY